VELWHAGHGFCLLLFMGLEVRASQACRGPEAWLLHVVTRKGIQLSVLPMLKSVAAVINRSIATNIQIFPAPSKNGQTFIALNAPTPEIIGWTRSHWACPHQFSPHNIHSTNCMHISNYVAAQLTHTFGCVMDTGFCASIGAGLDL
jgi:hypothetical protein